MVGQARVPNKNECPAGGRDVPEDTKADPVSLNAVIEVLSETIIKPLVAPI